ncbi:HIT family hydrolase, partial [Verrucomicrobiota bacterium]
MSNRPLWAPWRIEYILSEKNGNCFLCDIFNAPESDDRKNLLLHRGQTCAVTMNRYPYNGGH